MKRTALLFAALALSACDSDPEDATEARLAELDAEEIDEAVEGRRHHGRKHHSPATMICEQVACTDAQLERVQAAFAPPERHERHERGERPDMSAANADLAQAFSAESFGEADLQAWRDQAPDRPERGSHELDAMAQLHRILTHEQRITLSTSIASGEAFGHHRGKRHHEKHEGERVHDSDRHAEHLAHRVERFCEPLGCDEDQRAQLADVFEGHRGPHKDGMDALAKAFEADTFDADAVRELMGHQRDHGAKDAVAVQIHGILTAEQRATLAERIADDGPRAVMGKDRGHEHGRRHGKRRGKRRGKRGGAEGSRDGGREFG